MTQIVPFNPSAPAVFKLPEHLAGLFKSNTGGGGSVPKLAIKGKIWSVHKDDAEIPYLDEDGNALPSLKVVVLGQTTAPDGRPSRSRAWFAKAYDGSNQAPSCSSYDGVKPSEDSENPQALSCQGCGKSIKGSASDGVRAACQTGKRLAVIPSNDLEHEAFLLQLPITSIWTETDTHADKGWYCWDNYMKFLKRHNVPHTAMIETSMRFVPTSEYPQIVFKYTGQLGADSLEAVAARIDSDEVKSILGSDRGYATRVGKLVEEADEAPQQFVAPTPTKKPAPVDDGFDDEVAKPAPKAEKPTTVAKPKPVVEDDFDDAPAVKTEAKPKAEKAVVVEPQDLASALADWD